eukprot:NODE_623_length_5907_cov_0.380165.p6 type:complete len:107 gc:universal NODE_623_length_5907_cov_0.380165:1903-1583(-)
MILILKLILSQDASQIDQAKGIIESFLASNPDAASNLPPPSSLSNGDIFPSNLLSNSTADENATGNSTSNDTSVEKTSSKKTTSASSAHLNMGAIYVFSCLGAVSV